MASARIGVERTTAPSTPRRVRDRRFWLVLLAIAVAAGGVRVLAIYAVPHSPTNIYQLPAGDGFYYLKASEVLADTGEFGSRDAAGVVVPDVLHPPLYTAVLAGARLVGLDTVAQLRLFSAALGVVTTVVVGLAGRRLLSPATGIVAASIVAVSPAFWTYERNLNAEAVTFPLIAATILLAYRYRDRPSLWRCVALAAVGGVLALARSEQVLPVSIIIVALVLGTGDLDLRARLMRIGAAAITGLLILSPWTIYNAGRFDRPVLLSAGSGNAMTAGACDATFDGDLLGWYDASCWAGRLSYRPEIDRTVQDETMRSAAIDYTREHIGRLPVVVVAREGRTWAFFRVGHQNGEQAKAVDVPPSVVWIQTILFWASIPLASIGAILLRRQRIVIYPLLVFPAVAVVTVALTFGDIRYRAPAEVPIVLLTAAGLVLLARRIRRTEPADDSRAPPPTPGSG
jgi:4-amino-4-deoxy-L-arabinose transferase-like glycosyltransferase